MGVRETVQARMCMELYWLLFRLICDNERRTEF